MTGVGTENVFSDSNEGTHYAQRTVITIGPSKQEIIQSEPLVCILLGQKNLPAQRFPVVAQERLLLAAERPDQIRPLNAPAAQGFPSRLVLPDQLAT